MRHVAIVGSGPAGYYTAETLQKADDIAVDVIDRLPVPYGLIRTGVAPDHQSIKAVSRRYEGVALTDNVRFVGHVAVGTDVTIDELVALYDAVILATGAPNDRPLDIPGADLPGVIGSAAFVGWYNGHPDFAGLNPPLDAPGVAVIGNGNVALDVARVLAKNAEEMTKSDIVPEAGAAIAAAPITDIHVIGRRGAEHASFTNNELAEMGRLMRAVSVADASVLEAAAPASDPTPEKLRKTKNIDTLKGFAAHKAGEKPVTVHFSFHATPKAIRAGEVELSTGTVKADLVITCIGYTGQPFPQGESIFPVGWARRGPSGTIPTNRADSHAVAQQVLTWLKDRDPKSGPDVLPLAIDAAGWHRIDKHEIAAGAATGRPRVKLTEWQTLLDVAQGD